MAGLRSGGGGGGGHEAIFPRGRYEPVMKSYQQVMEGQEKTCSAGVGSVRAGEEPGVSRPEKGRGQGTGGGYHHIDDAWLAIANGAEQAPAELVGLHLVNVQNVDIVGVLQMSHTPECRCEDRAGLRPVTTRRDHGSREGMQEI